MAANIQQTSFSSPSYDYGADIAAIERRRQMAQMLQQEGMQPIPQQPVGAGQFATPISPLQGLAKMAQVYASKTQQERADDEQRRLAAKARRELADVLQRGQAAYTGTPTSRIEEGIAADPSKAASIYLSHPQTAALGMQIQQQELERKRRQQMMADILGPQASGAAPQTGATPGGPWSPEYAAKQPPQAGNNPTGIPSQALALIMSGDKDLAKVGGIMAGRGETQGRVSYDQDGNAFTVGKDGTVIRLPGIQQRVKPEAVNLGGATAFVDPYKQQGQLQHTIPPADEARLRFEGALPGPSPLRPQPAPMAPPSPAMPPQGAQPQVQPQAPAPAGQLNISPKQRQALEAERPQAGFAARSVMEGMHRIDSQIDKLLQNPSGVSGITGPIAGRTPSIRGSSVNAQADLEAMKSMMSVQELQRMRDASKTGGAVGSVTEKEWPRLEAQWAALQQSQTTDEFRKKLTDLRSTVRRMQGNTRKAYEDTYGTLDWKPPAGSEQNDPLGLRK